MTDKIRTLRTSKGWTQQTLADHAGLDKATISKIEQGSYNTTIKTLEQIADALGVRIPELWIGYSSVKPDEEMVLDYWRRGRIGELVEYWTSSKVS